ncbi:MAG: type II toxin-antitoxin system PemK/MazF family toxin [Promicromonosporaceae bacterium]|nr:type II toxin-antitoxin system PemK/MazF family toxin [Promicromonosporaceae bacterium]
MRTGDAFWFDFGENLGHGPARRRPVIVISSDQFVASSLPTVVVMGCTTNLAAARYPGNVLIPAGSGGLPRDCVAKVTEIATVDRYQLVDWMGTLPMDIVFAISQGLRLSLGT